MKKSLLVTVSMVVIGLAAPALAADLPARIYTKAPPVPLAAFYDWTGNGGYGWSRDCRRNVTTGANLGCYDATGGVAGGQNGYRWQSGGLGLRSRSPG